MRKRIAVMTIACAVSLACTLVVADDFEWMPKGGCELLQAALGPRPDLGFLKNQIDSSTFKRDHFNT